MGPINKIRLNLEKNGAIDIIAMIRCFLSFSKITEPLPQLHTKF